jgi:hypothetical protein
MAVDLRLSASHPAFEPVVVVDDFCGGAILNIDAASVLDVVFMLGVGGTVCLRLHCSTFSTVTRNCSTEIANLGAFFVASAARERPANAICSHGWETG